MMITRFSSPTFSITPPCPFPNPGLTETEETFKTKAISPFLFFFFKLNFQRARGTEVHPACVCFPICPPCNNFWKPLISSQCDSRAEVSTVPSSQKFSEEPAAVQGKEPGFPHLPPRGRLAVSSHLIRQHKPTEEINYQIKVHRKPAFNHPAAHATAALGILLTAW